MSWRKRSGFSVLGAGAAILMTATAALAYTYRSDAPLTEYGNGSVSANYSNGTLSGTSSLKDLYCRNGIPVSPGVIPWIYARVYYSDGYSTYVGGVVGDCDSYATKKWTSPSRDRQRATKFRAVLCPQGVSNGNYSYCAVGNLVGPG
jgi:hypothetical protein